MDDWLIKEIEHCTALPTVPTVALEVLELAREPDSGLDRLAEVIERDPALSGKILKTVNSPFYGCTSKVTTLEQAVVVLGLHAVRTLVLGFSLVDTMRSGQKSGFDHLLYWRHSFYTACAAKHLAQKIGLMHAEELFVCGLLSNIGMLVLSTVLGKKYDDLCSVCTGHSESAILEQSQLRTDHAAVAGYLLDKWRLPPVLSEPVRCHIHPEMADDPTLRTMAKAVQFAERCADVYTGKEPAASIAWVRSHHSEFIENHDEDAADELLAMVGESARTVAAVFEFKIDPEARYDRILRRANETLIELTLKSQQQAAEIKDHFLEREADLKKKAITDGLTGLANRAEMDRFLAEVLAEHVGRRNPLALIMVDIDNFKQINDSHGHPVGDAVLRYTAELLRGCIDAQNDLAARYGGEELVVVLPGTDRSTAAAIAEDLRSRLASKAVNCQSVQLPVTASFGVAAFEPSNPLTSPELLIQAADRALYHAKKCGRNRVKTFSIPHSTAV